MASRLNPSSESFIAIVDSEESSPIQIGQVTHQSGNRSAHLNFLVSGDNEKDDGLLALWDFLCYKAGEMGAINVLAEQEESSICFESLRKAGFSVYGWEAIIRLPKQVDLPQPKKSNWVKAAPAEDKTLRSLFQSLVPPLVQTAEAFANNGTPRLVYKENNEIVAYIESSSGPAGLYLKPVIHPSVIDINTLLSDLFAQFNGIGMPVYLQVRSYQAWLLDILESIGGVTSARFSLLVKHLAIMKRNGVTITLLNPAEIRHAEPTAPLLNNFTEPESVPPVGKHS